MPLWSCKKTVQVLAIWTTLSSTFTYRVHGWGVSSFFRPKSKAAPTATVDFEYDLVIIGAGASGLFASGAATMLGSKTLMVDRTSGNDAHDNVTSNIGGDCTNSACVPSKAVRSVARMSSSDRRRSSNQRHKHGRNEPDFLKLARSHATNTVLNVRKREDPNAMVQGNSNLDIALGSDCHFVSPHEFSVTIREAHSSSNKEALEKKSTTCDSNSQTIVRSKKFLIATGAAPIVPSKLEEAAKTANLPIYTYQTILRPSSGVNASASIWNFTADHGARSQRKRIVIAGGGATACELSQSLARLADDNVEIDLVAPILLRGEDNSLQNAAARLLESERDLCLHLGRRVEDVLPNRTIVLSDGKWLPPCDALVLCLGRSAGPSLKRLRLENANVQWNNNTGVNVNPYNLQSNTANHIYACGDCCSAVATNPSSRTATHAAWTGYFAAANSRLPRLLTRGAKAVHNVVPRVIYTDPELVSVGLSQEQCIIKYGLNDYIRLLVPTDQTDRADMEVLERGEDIGFIELRTTKIEGKIIGMTACGPAASELANEMSVILENGLRAIDVARSLHSYPSYGYMFHRVALAIAFGNIWGSLEASGTLGGWIAWWGMGVSKGVRNIKRVTTSPRRKARRAWEAEGASKSLILSSDNSYCSKMMQSHSFLDLATSDEWDQKEVERHTVGRDSFQRDLFEDFVSWLATEPQKKLKPTV